MIFVVEGMAAISDKIAAMFSRRLDIWHSKSKVLESGGEAGTQGSGVCEMS